MLITFKSEDAMIRRIIPRRINENKENEKYTERVFRNVHDILTDRLGFVNVREEEDGFSVTIENDRFHMFGVFILDYPYSNDKKTMRVTFTFDEKNGIATINKISQLYDKVGTKKWINKVIDVVENFCSELKSLD